MESEVIIYEMKIIIFLILLTNLNHILSW